MDRINATGILRNELTWALTQTRIVMVARKTDSCLLCRSGNVNEAGLCRVCFSMLTDEELVPARRWLAGTGP